MTKPKLIVLARFSYVDPKTEKEFTVDYGWPCKDQQDAELIVKYHGHKTGSYGAQCKIEEIKDEEIKPTQTETTTTQAHQA